MKYFKKICATLLTLALSVSVLPQSIVKEAKAVTALTDAQAKALVNSAIEKFKEHDAFAYVLEGDGDWDMYGYDLRSNIGIYARGYDSYAPVGEVGLDYPVTNWYDIKSSLRYQSTASSDIAYFEPLEDEETEYYSSEYFKEFFDLKEKGFLTADRYEYDGLTYREVAGEAHLCYKIVIPEDDPSLYKSNEYYYPKEFYIGVDDGEIYGIFEEYYLGSERETVIRKWNTDFFYPEKIEVPKELIKAADLEPYAYFKRNNLYYIYYPKVTKKGKGHLRVLDLYKNPTSIKIPASVTVGAKTYAVNYISDEAFWRETSLKSVSMGNSILAIEASAFYGCTKLKKITLSKKLSTIGEEAFKNCSSLQSITLGSKVKKLGKNVFKGCKKLKKIVVKNKALKKKLKTTKGRKAAGIPTKTKIV